MKDGLVCKSPDWGYLSCGLKFFISLLEGDRLCSGFFVCAVSFVFLLFVGIAGCGGGSGSGSDDSNTVPVADAGVDQATTIGTLVTLDGSGSSDADGDFLTYAWSLATVPTGSSVALSDETAVSPTFTADVDGEYILSLVVSDGLEDSVADTVTVTSGFVPPVDHVAVNFTIDDTANQTYGADDGLAWKGSFGFDSATRILSLDNSWGGPFVMLYDDGPWSSGGHEPAGATAGDSLWGVTVWVSNAANQTFEYGAISGSTDGSDGAWIWVGPNGTFTVSTGATTPIDATGLVLD
ncbi:MAG: PKD domain-containing protein [Syntrophotaleaceae bacterium]